MISNTFSNVSLSTIMPSTVENETESLAQRKVSDLALIRQVAKRDRQAFERFYHEYTPRLGRYIAKRLKHPELVGEVINDVMLVVWQKAAEFDPDRRLSSWVFGIAHNKALKALARHSRKTLDPPPDPFIGNGLQDPDQLAGLDNPEQTAMDHDLGRMLTQVLTGLSPEHRAVIELTFVEGFSYREIADITDCPVNTVKTRMFHARKRMALTLAAMGIEPLQNKPEEV